MWTMYVLGPLGLACDIFEGAPPAVALDAHDGYLAQSAHGLSLTVVYGPDADLDTWLEKMLGEEAVSVHLVEDRTAIEWCGGPAVRVTVEVTTPATEAAPIGYRLNGRHPVPIGDGPPARSLVTAHAGSHHGIALLATFQVAADPVADQAALAAEEHFFAAFTAHGSEAG